MSVTRGRTVPSSHLVGSEMECKDTNQKTIGARDNGKEAKRDRVMVVDLERRELDGKSKEIEERREAEMEPIVRKPILQRTPPTKKTPSTPAQKDRPVGKTHVERENSERRAGDGGSKKGGSTSQMEAAGERPSLLKRSGLMKSPTKKLVRTGSFSEVETKIKFGNVRGQMVEKEDKKRKRSDTDEPEGNSSSKGRRSAIQRMKEKLEELKEEMNSEVLKTSKMINLVEDMSILVAQAEVEELINTEESKDGGALRQRRIVNGKIKNAKTYNQFKEVEAMDWPEECYGRTEIKSGNFPTDKGDIIFLRNDDDPDMEMGVARRLRDNFPEIAQFKDDTWETLITSSRRASQTAQTTEWEKRIHVGKHAEGEVLYEELKKLKDLMLSAKRDRGVVPLEKDRVDKESVVKMLECIFYDTNIKFDVYSQDLLREQTKERRPFQNNALLVKTNRENYADTLRKVKTQIAQSGKNMEFRKIRSTREGNMLIELNEGDEGLDLEEVIGKPGGGIEVRLLAKTKKETQKYIIRDLDGLITKEEIEEILRENTITNEEKEAVRVISVRKADGDTQTAIIHLQSTQGERINSAGGITMGLIKSTLKKWVDVVKCYRCWEIGHRAAECKGIDRTTACLRCGGTDGHNSKNCSNADYCPLCQREGHRAGSGLCPKMRSALAGLRKQQEIRRRFSRK